MFSRQRLNTLFTGLGCSNIDIAKYAGCDPSNISRIRTGARIPAFGSRALEKVVSGMCTYADVNNLTKKLCALCGCTSDSLPDNIKEAVERWLFECPDGLSPLPVVRSADRDTFGLRLSAVMDLLELSNVKLGRLINIDPSYISRFRNGVRIPRANRQLAESLCHALLGQAVLSGKTAEVAELCGADSSAFENTDDSCGFFLFWLFGLNTVNTNTAVDRLLEHIESSPSESKVPLLPFESIAVKGILGSDTCDYSGLNGLQNAVVRFLGNAVCNGQKELWLYSDQNIDWMTGDKLFFPKWASLMSECVRRGVKIKIIHSIDRGADEMMAAIEGWLPLYMSGMIESFFFRGKANKHFSHTIFLAPGSACVHAFHVRGAETEGRYYYSTDEESLVFFQKEYSLLLEQSKPLVKIFTQRNADDYRMLFTEGFIVNDALLLAPSFGTIPCGLLESMLSKSGVPENEAKRLIALQKHRRSLLLNSLTTCKVREFMPLFSREELDAGTVNLNTGMFFDDTQIRYTPEDYYAHIHETAALMSEFDNYSLIPLKTVPFSGVQLLNCKDKTAVIKSCKAYAAFVFSGSEMLHAFRIFADSVELQNSSDRLCTIEYLKAYGEK